MYIYQTGPEKFGALELVPQDFFKFWEGDVDATDLGNYVKPIVTLPEITWEINYTAEEWRFMIEDAQVSSVVNLASLRVIPDSYIEAVFFNVLYGYSMSYNTPRTTYLPLRIGDSFTKNPMAYPGLSLVLLGLRSLIVKEMGKNTELGYKKAETLKTLLRHVVYVSVRIVKEHSPVTPTGALVVGALSNVDNPESEVLFFDPQAMLDFVNSGGSEELLAADWAINRRVADIGTLVDKESILKRWKSLTDITAE